MNLFESIPATSKEEIFQTLAEGTTCKIERIISYGHTSAEDFWYDQEEHEWLLLLEGEAIIAFDDGLEVALNKGDALNIKAHQRHQVRYTAKDKPTIWLAVFYK